MEKEELERLQRLSAKIRIDILEMLLHRGYGHLGGSMSLVELMSVLYGSQLTYDCKNPTWDKRDRVVLSKGHAGPVLYSALAESGFFPKEKLFTLNDGGTMLPSHPDRLKTPGVDMTTGSLGQGTSTAAGIAYGLKLKGSDSYTYLIVGDGELNEGQCWEAFQFIASNKLDHLIVIIDNNKRQLDGYLEQVINPFDIPSKMQAFGFATQTVAGRDIEGIDKAIRAAKANTGCANCIVLDSIKGAGIDYFEKLADNHSIKFNSEEIKSAAVRGIQDLKAYLEKVDDADV